MSKVDQQCKYNIKNMKNYLCIFLVITKSMSETRLN